MVPRLCGRVCFCACLLCHDRVDCTEYFEQKVEIL